MPPMAALPESPPHTACRLHIDYRDVPAATALTTPGTLAVFGFGANAPAAPTDPRYLQVALPALGRAPLECWQVDADVSHGHAGDIAWAQGGGLQFGALEIADAGDVEAAAAHAYTRLRRWLASSAYAHPLRIWNYLDAITEGDGDAERYRRFCVGRARGIGRELAPGELPAATAIGHPQRTGRLQLYWLAAEQAGTPLENPRQVQAWRYPRQYGPQPPGFARALLPPSPRMPLLLSGTAAVVGHASQHHGSLDAQLDEILANLHSLIDTARHSRLALPPGLGSGTRIKVYVRDAKSLSQVDAVLAARLPTVPRIVLHGHVCRHELLVEIDGSHE
jgi:chorismate lyase/3-hydroxybenzoate synthase